MVKAHLIHLAGLPHVFNIMDHSACLYFIAAGQLRAESAHCSASGYMLVCKCWKCPLNIYMAMCLILGIFQTLPSKSGTELLLEYQPYLSCTQKKMMMKKKTMSNKSVSYVFVHRLNHFWFTSRSESWVMHLVTSGNVCIFQNGKKKEVNLVQVP